MASGSDYEGMKWFLAVSIHPNDIGDWLFMDFYP